MTLAPRLWGAAPLQLLTRSDTWRPNVVLIQVDDMPYSALDVRTPSGEYVMKNVQRLLVRQGARFDNYHSSFPLCSPNRSTVLTGQYPHNHGVVSNDLPSGGFVMLDHDQTLPIWLHQTGYFTAHIGKYLNGYSAGMSSSGGLVAPRPPGWSDWFTDVRVTPFSTGGYYDYRVDDNGTIRHFGASVSEFHTDVLTERAVEIITQRAGSSQPFFVLVDYFAPHGAPTTAIAAPRHDGAMAGALAPRSPSFDELDVSDKPLAVRTKPQFTPADEAQIDLRYQKIAEALLSVDEGVARIVRTLENTGALEETILIFTSDNGWQQGEHRLALNKGFPYTESTRVPLVLRGPDIPRQARVDALVGVVDLTPTLLEWSGATPSLAQDGRSFAPLLRGQVASIRDELLLENPEQKSFTGMRTRHPVTGAEHLYVEYDYDHDQAWDEREYYELIGDPCRPAGDRWMLESQHADPCAAGDLDALHLRLMHLKACVGGGC